MDWGDDPGAGRDDGDRMPRPPIGGTVASRDRNSAPATSQGSGGRGCALGCLLAIVAVVLLPPMFLSNLRIVPEEPPAIRVDARWTSHTVDLPGSGSAVVVRVAMSYSGSALGTRPAVTVSPPREAAGTTPDPASAVLWLSEPAVRMTVTHDAHPGVDCLAACEVAVGLADCARECTTMYDVRLEVMNAAGRSRLVVDVSAGANADAGGHLPDGFGVRIDQVGTGPQLEEGM